MNLARAIEIAVAAHAGQTDKAGTPYILHPIRVMLAQDTDDARIVGILHDVVEDAPEWTFDRLRDEGFSDAVLTSLRAVTKSPEDADYATFVARAARDPIGRQVKRADLLDNLNAARLGRIGPDEAARLDRYARALASIST
jgi:(p)ppGpp synthase/HD superfamily hydrolase